MYCILMDKETKSFYMAPHEFFFHAYTGREYIKKIPPNAKLVETEFESKKEFTTMLYNAGFTRGYINNQLILLTKKDAYYYDKCLNEVAFAQYLLTKDTSYLENIIEKNKLLTVCKIQDNTVLFPTVQLKTGEIAVLTYTDLSRIPKSIFDKYPDFKIVKMTFDVKCIVNDKFIAE